MRQSGGVKLLWIVAGHLRQYRAVRAYRGRPHWGVRNPVLLTHVSPLTR
jgi:hypothetical protein